uniref:Uncharacterized protein n=1 Tax=Rhizophora mucronata TaxID=61149 RepID=A0A2P2IPY8_RHIMU
MKRLNLSSHKRTWFSRMNRHIIFNYFVCLSFPTIVFHSILSRTLIFRMRKGHYRETGRIARCNLTSFLLVYTS